MWHSFKIFLFLPPLLFALDYIWLGVFASSLYKKELGGFLRLSGEAMQPVIWAALVVYIAIPAGIVLFALPRVSPHNLVASSFFWGGLFGLVVYTIYDMTNYSLLRDWPLRVSLIDICWGVFLNAVGTLAAAYLDRWLNLCLSFDQACPFSGMCSPPWSSRGRFSCPRRRLRTPARSFHLRLRFMARRCRSGERAGSSG